MEEIKQWRGALKPNNKTCLSVDLICLRENGKDFMCMNLSLTWKIPAGFWHINQPQNPTSYLPYTF